MVHAGGSSWDWRRSQLSPVWHPLPTQSFACFMHRQWGAWQVARQAKFQGKLASKLALGKQAAKQKERAVVPRELASSYIQHRPSCKHAMSEL